MPGKTKLGGYKEGYGYCGYYTDRLGNQHFLRSAAEFLIAKQLDEPGVFFKTEQCIYTIDGKNYKPDFFIYEDESYNKLVKIIEVKDTKARADEYIKLYTSYFTSIGIDYKVVYTTKKLRSRYLEEYNKWIQSSINTYRKTASQNENNPMYGVKHQESTKQKIGDSTKERFEDPEFRAKHSKSLKAFWSSPDAEALKIKYAKLRSEEKEIKNPILDIICAYCGKVYKRRLKDRYNIKTCSSSCAQKFNRSNKPKESDCG